MGDHDQGMCAKGHKAAGQSGRGKLWEDRTLLPEGAEMSVKLIPVRNSVREEKRKKGDGEWAFFFLLVVVLFWASQVALVVKNLPANAGYVRDAGSIPGSGRCLGVGNGNLLQYWAWRILWTKEPGESQRVRHD